MKQLIIPALCLMTACSQEQDAGMVQPSSEGYQRIISMDYCADQYVLALAEREDILALSPDADKTFSYLRDQADGIPQIRPVAESVLAAQPDLIVRSYGGGP
ncbi:MAG TPA: iron ABC transporter substrate-binding protein, partial [Hyphomonadaceae bacterium]|nr:iron ABC transporter substrate-binding protein [Hyphomonadaceae bacterium]